MIVRVIALALACLLFTSGQPAELGDSPDDAAQLIAADVAVLPAVSADVVAPPSVRVATISSEPGSAGRLHCSSVFRPPRVA